MHLLARLHTHTHTHTEKGREPPPLFEGQSSLTRHSVTQPVRETGLRYTAARRRLRLSTAAVLGSYCTEHPVPAIELEPPGNLCIKTAKQAVKFQTSKQCLLLLSVTLQC